KLVTFLPLTLPRADVHEIFRTAIVKKIHAIIISNHMITSITIIIGPPLPSIIRDCDSCKNAVGKLAIIPIIISNEIPFPIPLSVIFSPNHIAKTVPVVKIKAEENKKEKESKPNKNESGGNCLYKL